MLQYDTRALARPQHPFDFAAIAANSLATLGTAALRFAAAIDAARARRREARLDAAVRPRDRLGPRGERPAARFDAGRHRVTDGWRIR